jgi:hypothetical protein
LNFFKFSSEEINKAVDVWSSLRHTFKKENNSKIINLIKIVFQSEESGLTYLAKFLLMVPSSSVSNERLFSILKNNKNDLRSCLSDNHLNWILFLHQNISYPVPDKILTSISKIYIQSINRREGCAKEIEKVDKNTLFLYENFHLNFGNNSSHSNSDENSFSSLNNNNNSTSLSNTNSIIFSSYSLNSNFDEGSFSLLNFDCFKLDSNTGSSSPSCNSYLFDLSYKNFKNLKKRKRENVEDEDEKDDEFKFNQNLNKKIFF